MSIRDLSLIKFRIWDVLDKDWVEVGSGTLPQIALVFGKGGADFNTPMIAQEWTGLFDKNERPLFEGDVVKRYCPGEDCTDYWTGEICYRNGSLIFRDYTEKTDSNIEMFEEDGGGMADLEVIGNILQTPELLPNS